MEKKYNNSLSREQLTEVGKYLSDELKYAFGEMDFVLSNPSRRADSGRLAQGMVIEDSKKTRSLGVVSQLLRDSFLKGLAKHGNNFLEGCPPELFVYAEDRDEGFCLFAEIYGREECGGIGD